jgi:predicted SAM-dependent methyltransferase
VRKVQFGCGGNKIESWENYDREIDITKPLPFPDDSIKFALAEHVLEHVHVHDGFRFLKELYRVMEPGGTARICVPGIDVLFEKYGPEYAHFMQFHKLGDGSLASAMDSIVYGFEHQAVYTVQTITILAKVAGFEVKRCQPRVSDIPELNDLDAHWTAIGEMANATESIVVELTKPE